LSTGTQEQNPVAHWLLVGLRVRSKYISVVGVVAVIVAHTSATASAPRTEADVIDVEADALDPVARVHDLEVLRNEAAASLARGDFGRARILYDKVSELDRTDAFAVRTAGRAAAALGDFEYAADALRRADLLARHAPDPELHYLRGEALFVLERRAEALREDTLVERELAAMAPTRQSQLWLARVYARRGELARADALYRAIPPAVGPIDVEVSIHRAEAHFLNHDWNGTEQILTELLARSPDQQQAQDMLALTFEASGRLDDELALRAAIAGRATTDRPVFDYGRALERSADFAAALRTYQRADQLAGGSDDPEVTGALRRMAQATSIEVAAAVRGRSDPQATSLGEQIGIARPFGSAHHVVLGAWYEHMTGSAGSREGSAGELWTALVLHHRAADAIVGGTLGYLDHRASDGSTISQASWSGFASIRGQPTRHLKFALDGEANALWRETPLTLLERGHVTAATLNVYGIALDERVILDAGAQRRRLVLSGRSGGGDPSTSQSLGWVGCDVVAWVNFARSLEGRVLDDNLLRPAPLADSVVVSYRHYELRSDSQPEFMDRISMVVRASIDEGSLVARKVLAQDRIGVELRGALGWDHARAVATSRAGVSLLANPTRSSRISLSFDVGAESPNGFRGQIRTGWVSYHAEL
jgi:tetratricopeptide (TPR) repeat protein